MHTSVLLTGGSGLLAINWAATIRDRYQTVLGLHERTVRLQNVTSCNINIESADQALRGFDKLQPTMIIHTAGLTNVELCETNPDLAKHINVDLAVNVAKAARELDIPMVQISTDHLFEGNEKLLSEDAVVTPLNNYGRTKAEAETRVFETYSEALIIRTNFYGWGPSYRRSFSDMIIEALAAEKSITLFEDVFYSPILAQELVEVVHELIDAKCHGVFNVVGDERVSKLEFGRKIAAHFNLDQNLIKPGRIVDQKHLVPRPSDMSLSNRKVSECLKRHIGGVDSHLKRLVKQKEDGIASEIKDI